MILEGICYTFQFHFGINFGEFEFQVGGNVSLNNYSGCLLLFLPHVLFCCFLQASYYSHFGKNETKQEKNGFTVFHNFLLSEILLTLISQKYFSLVFNITITLLLIIVPVFIGPFFVGSKHYRFSERFSHKAIVVKTQNFYFNWCDLV